MIGPWLYSGLAHSVARPDRPNQNSGSAETTARTSHANPAGFSAAPPRKPPRGSE